MKKLTVLLLCLSLTLLAACGSGKEPATESAVPETTEAPAETTEVPSETTEAPTETVTETVTETEEPEGPLTAVSVSAQLYHDSVGNVWLQFVGAYKNTGDTPLELDYADVILRAEGTESVALTSVEPYPQIIAPGETAYYYEEKQVDLDDSVQLTPVLKPEFREAQEPVRYEVTESAVKDTSYGPEVRGTLEPAAQKEENMICVAAVLLDKEEKPLAVLFDYFTPEDIENGFDLSGGHLPGEFRGEDAASCLIFAYPYEV